MYRGKTHEKRIHNAEVMQDFIEKAEGKTVGILNKKNLFDKGSKIKLSRGSHEILETEGYNIRENLNVGIICRNFLVKCRNPYL